MELEYLLRQRVEPSIAELVAATGLPKSTVSRAIGNLLGTGTVSEEINPANRRYRIFEYWNTEGPKFVVNTALEQIEKYLGPNAEAEILRMFNANMDANPELRASLDMRRLGEIIRERE